MTALLEVTNNWAYNVDQGRVEAVVILDLKKLSTSLTMEFCCETGLMSLRAVGLGHILKCTKLKVFSERVSFSWKKFESQQTMWSAGMVSNYMSSIFINCNSVDIPQPHMNHLKNSRSYRGAML